MTLVNGSSTCWTRLVCSLKIVPWRCILPQGDRSSCWEGQREEGDGRWQGEEGQGKRKGKCIVVALANLLVENGFEISPLAHNAYDSKSPQELPQHFRLPHAGRVEAFKQVSATD